MKATKKTNCASGAANFHSSTLTTKTTDVAASGKCQSNSYYCHKFCIDSIIIIIMQHNLTALILELSWISRYLATSLMMTCTTACSSICKRISSSFATEPPRHCWQQQGQECPSNQCWHCICMPKSLAPQKSVWWLKPYHSIPYSINKKGHCSRVHKGQTAPTHTYNHQRTNPIDIILYLGNLLWCSNQTGKAKIWVRDIFKHNKEIQMG